MRGVGFLTRPPEFVTNIVQQTCPECWLQGCGLDPCYGQIADCLELINPFLGAFASAVWCLGSPLAFPCIFCFDSNSADQQNPKQWKITMLQAPCVRPCACCCTPTPCGQWYVRRKVLNGDMTRYKLWQGYHDGPQCLARHCPGAPITIASGTYGEQDCPNLFLCLEATILGGCYSCCCSFDVSRRLLRDQLHLPMDPTEVRQHNCQVFFGTILRQVAQITCCLHITACCCACCAPESEGAQDFAGEARRTGRACASLGRTLWKGIWATKLIAMGCMSAQMIHQVDTVEEEEIKIVPHSGSYHAHEEEVEIDLTKKLPTTKATPKHQAMDRDAVPEEAK